MPMKVGEMTVNSGFALRNFMTLRLTPAFVASSPAASDTHLATEQKAADA
jgi:hypothetical protein